MTKVRQKSLVFVGFFLLLLIGLFVRLNWLSRNIPSAQVIWNDQQLYIFVDENNVLWSGSLIRSALDEIKTSVMAVPRPTKQVFVCKVFVWSQGALEAHEVRDFKCAGMLAPYDGHLYAFVGGREGGVFRWTGRAFEKLDSAEEKSVLGSFTLRNNLFAREHWSQDWTYYPFPGIEKTLDIPLRDGPVKLVAEHENSVLAISILPLKGQAVQVYRGEDRKGYISSGEAIRYLH